MQDTSNLQVCCEDYQIKSTLRSTISVFLTCSLKEPLLLTPSLHLPTASHSWFAQLGSGVHHQTKKTCELKDNLAILDILEDAEKAKPSTNQSINQTDSWRKEVDRLQSPTWRARCVPDGALAPCRIHQVPVPTWTLFILD